MTAMIRLILWRTHAQKPYPWRFDAKAAFNGNRMMPQTPNRYVYCQNNPIMLVDPSGMAWVDVIGAGVGLAAGVVATGAFIAGAPVVVTRAAVVGFVAAGFGIYREATAYTSGRQSGGQSAAGAMLSAGGAIGPQTLPFVGPAFGLGSVGLELGETLECPKWW